MQHTFQLKNGRLEKSSVSDEIEARLSESVKNVIRMKQSDCDATVLYSDMHNGQYHTPAVNEHGAPA